MVRYSNGGLKNRTEKSLFVVQNVRYYNGPPSHVTLPFEYQTSILMNLVFRCSVFCIQFSIQYSEFEPPLYFVKP